MLLKVFILPQFGAPHPWTEQYLAHVRTLAPYGWHWLIPTPHAYASSENVTILPMTLCDFNARVLAVTGVTTGNVLDQRGCPMKLLSDYYPAFGELFADELVGCDYWSASNWDMVFGRLDHFLSDAQLSACDIWSDDYRHVNSIFCFYKNTPAVNQLYRRVPQWQAMFQFHGYPLFGFDELHFDPMIREMAARGELAFGHAPYFAFHSYDRLVQHLPVPNLTIAPDGALLECFDDDYPMLKRYPPWRGFVAREIAYFHFIRTKAWPKLRPYPVEARMIDPRNVSACFITKDAVYPPQIIEDVMRFGFGEYLFLTHCPSPHLKQSLFAKATHKFIYYQDDDCLAPIDALLGWAAPNEITCAMKASHVKAYEDSQIALLGWGSLFPKTTIRVLDRYRSMYGEDALYRRESERIMTWFAFPQRRLQLPIIDLSSAWAPDRLSMQPDHYSYIPIVEQRCRELAMAAV